MPVAGAHQVRVPEILRVVRAVDTVNGQLFVDLIVKVEGEAASTRTDTGVLTQSTEMELKLYCRFRRICQESTELPVQTCQSHGEGVICD